VRDLLLGRRPKDFDIGTSAHPYQVKRLFRNCWIIGRRFRLAHVKFGTKTIEVATFRRQVSAEELAATEVQPQHAIPIDGPHGPGHDRLLHRDNTFGTPEEDAFRRDFTVNALFYDISSFSIIDYTGGLHDLKARVMRCIGEPAERFQEDPVRMLRAVAMAARLDFAIDPPIDEAIAKHRGEIARAAPARLVEEFYKLLRAGAAERAFRMLAERRLLEPIAAALQRGASERLWTSLAAVDAYRRRFEDIPDTLTNPILLGSLLVPLGHTTRTLAPPPMPEDERRKPPVLSLGMLPLARRDVERLRQVLALQQRLVDMQLSPRARRALMHRGPFREALTWLEIHGGAPDALEHWRGFIEAAGTFEAEAAAADGAEGPSRNRRRRRRRRRHPSGPRRHGDTGKKE
jgi:poly(A) polymerase